MSHTSQIIQEALSGKLSTFGEAQLLCGFTDERAAEYCGVYVDGSALPVDSAVVARDGTSMAP